MNVVFPAPLTPTTRITVGPDLAWIIRGSLFPDRSEPSMALLSASRNWSWVLMIPRRASDSISATRRIVVGTPKSASRRISSSFSSDPWIAPARAIAATSASATSFILAQSERAGTSPARLTILPGMRSSLIEGEKKPGRRGPG